MIQTGKELDFAQKPVSQFLLRRKVGQKNLHRLNAVGNCVPYLVNLPHSARAEYSQDFVVSYPLPGNKIIAHRGTPLGGTYRRILLAANAAGNTFQLENHVSGHGRSL